jgi:hypothetical protein
MFVRARCGVQGGERASTVAYNKNRARVMTGQGRCGSKAARDTVTRQGVLERRGDEGE